MYNIIDLLFVYIVTIRSATSSRSRCALSPKAVASVPSARGPSSAAAARYRATTSRCCARPLQPAASPAAAHRRQSCPHETWPIQQQQQTSRSRRRRRRPTMAVRQPRRRPIRSAAASLAAKTPPCMPFTPVPYTLPSIGIRRRCICATRARGRSSGQSTSRWVAAVASKPSRSTWTTVCARLPARRSWSNGTIVHIARARSQPRRSCRFGSCHRYW